MAPWIADARARLAVGGQGLVTLGDAWAEKLRLALAREQFDFVHGFFRRCEPRRSTFYLNALSVWPDRPSALDRWVAAEPDSSLPWLVRGAQGVRWAFSARGSRRSSSVSEDSWARFFERIESAQDDLYQAAELDLANHCPWAFLVTVGYGSWSGLEEIRPVFEEARCRQPDDWRAHEQMLNASCAKWHGSHTEMFGFARRIAAAAEPSSGLQALVALAHLERWRSVKGDEAVEYARRPEVAEEIADAWASGPGACRVERRLVPQYNAFAAAGWIAGSKIATAALKKTRGQASENPWRLIGSPSRTYARACRDLAVS